MEIIRQFIRERIEVCECGHVDACWAWSRCTRDGYGRADIGGRTHQAHRVSYEAFVGPIPDGLELDHLCCVANCVNPDHLEPVTREENLRRKAVRRGYVIGGKAYIRRPRTPPKPKTPPAPINHCRRGHEYTPENTRIARNGRGETIRCCRVCIRRRRKEYWERRNERENRTATRKDSGGTEAASSSGPLTKDASHKRHAGAQ